ncbi:MAG: chemotaxis protein CheD [Phycisphaerae bacterium]|nr:chemotaxis protein CheD [Phycisphaerae bacterium]
MLSTAVGPAQFIGIGELRVVREPERLRTVLGSCIGVALFDRKAMLAGLSHVILPSSKEGSGARGKFADTAVDDLIQQMMEAGADRARLCGKMVGGARMFGAESQSDLGSRNIEAVRDRLRHHRIAIIAEDVGGMKGRKMFADPATAAVEVQIIGEAPRVI